MSLARGLSTRLAALAGIPLRAPLPPSGGNKKGRDRGAGTAPVSTAPTAAQARMGLGRPRPHQPDLPPHAPPPLPFPPRPVGHPHHPLAGPRKTGEMSTEVATGCALMKGENDPPLGPDSDYPPWLFKLLDGPEGSSAELQKQYETSGLDLGQVGGTGARVCVRACQH
jgi:hypothetical protein